MQKSVIVLLLLSWMSCKEKEKADLIITRARIYTAEDSLSLASCMAVAHGRILAVGDEAAVIGFAGKGTQMVDLQGAFVMPGLIEGHGHFLGLGKSLYELNMLHAGSWREILDSVKSIAARTPPGEWIVGRGWHQDKWNDTLLRTFSGYPYHTGLSDVSPENPVMLKHASGHALIANRLAMERSGITSESMTPAGGRIVRDRDGFLIGVFEENAMDLIMSAYKDYHDKWPDSAKWKEMTRQAYLASEKALEYGITSFHDAGSSVKEISLLESACKDGTVKQRMYVMLLEPEDSLEQSLALLPWPSYDEDRFTCGAVKLYMDGALGSYGAWLLDDYDDNPGIRGQNLMNTDVMLKLAREVGRRKLQLCVHAIGDRGNKEVLDVMEKVIQGQKEVSGMRWRIEHAQHIHRQDVRRFKDMGVIASIQAIHCTSDAPFVIKRLGYERARTTSYVWRSLLDAGVHLANGTDSPVESVNPWECIFAAVTRRRVGSDQAFFPEECMTRDEALRSYTIWNAYASNDENRKGSLKAGKIADFVVLDRNLISCSDDSIPGTRVMQVFMDGRRIR